MFFLTDPGWHVIVGELLSVVKIFGIVQCLRCFRIIIPTTVDDSKDDSSSKSVTGDTLKVVKVAVGHTCWATSSQSTTKFNLLSTNPEGILTAHVIY